MPTMLETLKNLPISERADLAQALWDSILEESESLPLPESHRTELEKRLQNSDPKLIPWEEVKTRLRIP
jgi:putative addiction module component (TIGR02574 family)